VIIDCHNSQQGCELHCCRDSRAIGFLAYLVLFETEMNAFASLTMLAEKFFLVLETLRSHASDDRPAIMTRTAPPPAVPAIATALHCTTPVPDKHK
jgi:hypothetical protein